MTCKICKTNETDSTSGICWECSSYPASLNDDYYHIYKVADLFVRFCLDDLESSAFARVLLKLRDKAIKPLTI